MADGEPPNLLIDADPPPRLVDEDPPPPPRKSKMAMGFNKDYLKTTPGIFKVVEILLGVLVFICAVAFARFVPCYKGIGFVVMVAFTAVITTLVWLVLHLMNMMARLDTMGRLIEFIYYVIYTVLYFIAFIICAWLGPWHTSIAAAAVFAFFATALYAADTAFQFRAHRESTAEPGPTPV